jgi:hypothetical protein
VSAGRVSTWMIGGALSAASIGLFAACGSSDARLATLKTDPMTTYELPSAVTSKTTESAGGTSAVSSPSTFRRRFTVATGEGDEAIRAIAEAAVKAGWTLHPIGDGYGGDKTIDDINAQITIQGVLADDVVWFELSSRSD